VAQSLTDSSVVPIDVGGGAREQTLPPKPAAETNKQLTQSSPEIPVDDLSAKERDGLAERYFKNDLADQRGWYSQKAALFKTRSELLALLTIVLGALITFIQVLGPAPWLPIVSGSIGAMVAIAAGWQRIARYSETWISYRTASERMKRERRLYTHGAGVYRRLPEREAYLTLSKPSRLQSPKNRTYFGESAATTRRRLRAMLIPRLRESRGDHRPPSKPRAIWKCYRKRPYWGAGDYGSSASASLKESRSSSPARVCRGRCNGPTRPSSNCGRREDKGRL
jgi:Protein of unknown function (DUF4231)